MPQKIRKATTTQNSASANSSCMGVSRSGVDLVERGLDRLRSRSLAGQALDDDGRRVAGDAAHVAHRLGLAGRDGRLGFGEALVEVGFESLTLGIAFGRKLGAGLLREGLRTALGFREGLFVGRPGLF